MLQNSHVEMLTSKMMVLGHKGGGPMNKISVVLKETSRSSLHLFTMWGHRKKATIYEPGSRSHQIPDLIAY